MLPHNLALAIEQEQRVTNDLAALDAAVAAETDRHYQGQADGALGFEPKQPEDNAYWSGYCIGLRKFYWLGQVQGDSEF